MTYGICHLSVVAVRTAPEHSAELFTQLLYGDHFRILESRKFWSRIRIAFDGSEGWLSREQYRELSPDSYNLIENTVPVKFASDLIAFTDTGNDILVPVLLGSCVQYAELMQHRFEGSYTERRLEKSGLVFTALLYLHAPYFQGGKSPFGIDSAGLAQMVYRMQGYALPRQAAAQAMKGEALSFIEECEAGDLAFFDNKEGVIEHVGILMENNYIIHAYGKVRIDRLDHTGIFNRELGTYTHPLRVLKKLL